MYLCVNQAMNSIPKKASKRAPINVNVVIIIRLKQKTVFLRKVPKQGSKAEKILTKQKIINGQFY